MLLADDWWFSLLVVFLNGFFVSRRLIITNFINHLSFGMLWKRGCVICVESFSILVVLGGFSSSLLAVICILGRC